MTDLVVTSGQNPRVKLVRKLGERRGRVREGAFVVEGEDLVEAGLVAGWPCRFVLIDPEVRTRAGLLDDCDVVPVSSELLAELSMLAHPPRMMGVFELGGPSDLQTRSGATVFLDGVRDPGNVGTVLRAGVSLGAAAVSLGPDTADPFGPKAVRASMGAVFSIAATHVAGVTAGQASTILALEAGAPQNLWDVDLGPSPVICIGGERSGLRQATLDVATVVASIPQAGGIDSLNAAMAATLALYEWRRQQEHA